MAESESIKRARVALDDECARAQAMAACLSETHPETTAGEAAWVWMHQDSIRRLTEAVDALNAALEGVL